MKNIITYIVCGLMVIGALFLGFSWGVYKYKDCKKVGHSTFYCVMDFGK